MIKRRKSRPPGQALPRVWLDAQTAPAIPAQGNFVALVAGQDVPLIPLDLPPGLKGTARERVAERQMHDLCGGGNGQGTPDPEMRPAPLGPDAAQWDHALRVDPGARGAWLAALGPAAARCAAILPDYLALPVAPGLWVIDTGEDTRAAQAAEAPLSARLGPTDGFTAEAALALSQLTLALRDAGQDGRPRAILRLGPPLPSLDDWLTATGIPVVHDEAEAEAQGVPRPQCFAHGELALDLSRDPGAELADLRHRLRPFVLPAAMAVLALGAWCAGVLLETGAMRDDARAYRVNAERILRDVMIPTGPILDMRAQAEARLKDRRDAAAQAGRVERPLDLFRIAALVLAQQGAEGDQPGGPRITRAGYRKGAGLVIDLQVADFAQLDALVTALRAAGLTLEVAQSAARENEGVNATLALATLAPDTPQ